MLHFTLMLSSSFSPTKVKHSNTSSHLESVSNTWTKSMRLVHNLVGASLCILSITGIRSSDITVLFVFFDTWRYKMLIWLHMIKIILVNNKIK